AVSCAVSPCIGSCTTFPRSKSRPATPLREPSVTLVSASHENSSSASTITHISEPRRPKPCSTTSSVCLTSWSQASWFPGILASFTQACCTRQSTCSQNSSSGATRSPLSTPLPPSTSSSCSSVT